MRRRWWLLLLLLPVLVLVTALVLLRPRPVRELPTTASGPQPTGVFNILLIGRDARALGPVANEGAERAPREERSHSDVVILAHFNLELGRFNLVALPRDLLVGAPGYTAESSATDFTRMEKLTHVHAIGGPKLLRRTVERLLGATIDRHAGFDFDTFRMTFGLLEPFLSGVRVAGTALTSRKQALKFARRRVGLREDDIDRSRNNLLLVKEFARRLWWLADTRLGGILLRRVLGTLGPDTDLTAAEVEALITGLRARGFQPDSIGTAVLVGEGAEVYFERYAATLSAYLPAYAEIRRQADRWLLDLDTPALDFMTRQEYRMPAYLFADYSPPVPADTVPADSAALATRQKEMELLGIPAGDSGR